MELDWTTFVLEVINFLVLVWILQRYLYRPVLNILAARKTGIERVLAEAKEAEERASALKGQFESRLADWEQEKAAARASLETALALERERQMEALAEALAAERERTAAQEAHRQEALRARTGGRGRRPGPALRQRTARPGSPDARRRHGWSSSSSRSWARCPRSVSSPAHGAERSCPGRLRHRLIRCRKRCAG
jgi:F-type H+-transporting ATPase subunit b